ncbi:hypothetical protein LP420_21715 [Massilia sp. B-10]|nr:hypothetical protein LP420_21715 [Massilia sp. B-10]
MEIEPVLKIAALGFRYGQRPVFHDFTVTLDAGITWLRGPNGKGKTTLLRLMAGGLDPHATAASRSVAPTAPPIRWPTGWPASCAAATCPICPG